MNTNKNVHTELELCCPSPVRVRPTHPVDIDVAFWNDVGVEEGGFTS